MTDGQGKTVTNILVIEDEPHLRSLLARLLAAAAYTVSTAATGAEGLRAALAEDPDLVLLDLMLPDLTGEEILQLLLARRPGVRVLAMSSAPDVERRVGVLDNGAIDFLPKPFVNGELLARVRLRMRDRTGGDEGAAAPAAVRIDARAQLDTGRRELVLDGRRVPLSRREYDLLHHLARRLGTTCTREELLADVWGLSFDPGTNVVDVYIGRVRTKLASSRIETVRNVGYRLAPS